MTSTNRLADSLQSQEWNEVQAIVHAFESAWQQNDAPPIAQFLEGSAETRLALLMELVHIDMEFRIKCGQRTRVEEYLHQFPDLAEKRDQVLELITSEFQLRSPRERDLRMDSYLERFPRYRDDLMDRFQKLTESIPNHAADTQIPRPVAMRPPRDESPDATCSWQGPQAESPARPPSESSSSSTAKALSGLRCGEYELLGELGRGGMGVVYKARHRTLGRLAAVKMMLSSQFVSGEQIKRFYVEAEAAALLDHTGIVPIFEVGQHAGEHFLAMAYVDGVSLWEKVKEQPLEPRAAARIMRQVAEAVHHAHQRGVLHRDLKPQNILLTNDGQPRVTDFGLAKRMAADSSLTATGQVMGTPSYMPPEQALGSIDELDQRADVYSIGATLYCLLTSRPPFRAANVLDTIKQVLEQEPVSLRLLVPTIDRDLETICLKCLAKNRNERYATAHELADELQRFLDNEPILARRIGPVARAWRWCKRKPIVASLGATVVVAAVALLFAWSGARQAQRLQQLTNLNGRFETGLDKPALTGDYLEKMDTLVAAIETLDRTAATAARTRLDESWSKMLDESIRRPRLNPDDVEQLEAAISMLTPRDATTASSLREKLKKRVGDWQHVFELQPAFNNVAQVFGDDQAQIKEGNLQRVTTPIFRRVTLAEGGESRGQSVEEPLQTVPSTIPSGGSVRVEAVFGSSWRNATRLGVVIDASKRGGYSFVLMSGMRGVENRTPNADTPTKEYIPFTSLREKSDEVQIVVYKRDIVIRRQSIPLMKLGTGELIFRATRDRDRLTFQLNDLPMMSIFDPFPLTSRDGGFFGVDWPPGVEVRRLLAERKATPTNPSPLQQADEFYDSGRLAEAEALFLEQSRTTKEDEIRREARCKRGLCLLELGRRDEAAEVLESVMAEPGDRWPVIAACQLWLLNLRQEKSEQANAIFEYLSTRYQFEQLAVLIPSDVRDDILRIYFDELHSYEKMLRFRPERLENIERAARIDRFLSYDGHGSMRQLQLSKAYRFAGDHGRALEVAQVLARDYPEDANLIKHFSRILRQTGRLFEALEAWDLYFQRVANQNGTVDAMAYLERSRAYAAIQNWQQAEADIDHILQLPVSGPPDNRISAALMKGFLQEHRGNLDAAQQTWKEAFHSARDIFGKRKTISATPLEIMILGSLTGELSSDDTNAFMSLFSGAETQNSIINTAMTAAGQQVIDTGAREMWRTPRGRAYAAAFAFESLFMADRARIPLALACVTLFEQHAPGGEVSPTQDAIVWNLSTALIDKLIFSGELQSAQALQLALTWKGTTNFLGWGGVSPTLAPDLRGPLAYVLGLRFLKLNNTKLAADFFATAEKDAPPNSPLSRVVTETQSLLKTGNGRLLVDSELTDPIQVAVRQGEDEIVVLTVEPKSAKPAVSALAAMIALSTPAAAGPPTEAEAVFFDLPPGEYEVALVTEKAGVQLSKNTVTVRAVGLQRVTVK